MANFYPNAIGPIGNREIARNRPVSRSSNKVQSSFADILKEKTVEASSKTAVEFSKHAEKKIEQRRIQFSGRDLEKIGDAIAKLRLKGGKEGLLLYQDLGLLVNVSENKVITCVDKSHLRENVFTNIDSVAIVE